MAQRSRIEELPHSTYEFTELIGQRIQNDGETSFADGRVVVIAHSDETTFKPSITVTAKGPFDLPEGRFDYLHVGYVDGPPGTSLIEGLSTDKPPVEITDESSQRSALKAIFRIIYNSSKTLA